MNPLNEQFTHYPNAYTPDPCPDLMAVERLHEVIRTGTLRAVGDLKTVIEALRRTQDSGLKRRLPFVMVAGQFGRNHTRQSFVAGTETGYRMLDFDHIALEQIAALKQQWQRHPFVHLVFVSPSGNGLKVLVRAQVDAGSHAALYHAVGMLLAEGHPTLEPDPKASGFSQGCFLSYDPDVYVNPNAEVIMAEEATALIARFPVALSATQPIVLSAGQAELVEQEFVEIDEEQIDCASLPKLLASFIAELEKHHVRWIGGGRHEFLFNLVQLKRYGVTAEALWPYLVAHVDGRWTPERTKSKTKALLESLFVHYLGNYDLHQIGEAPEVLAIEQYVGEKLAVVAGHLKHHRTIYLDAPTGAGKTALVLALAEELGVTADLLMPTRTLVQQQHGDGIASILGSAPLREEHRKATVLAACYPAIGKIGERGAELLVVDEAHSLVSDYPWKTEAIQALVLAITGYKYVLFLSGSMLPMRNSVLAGYHLRVALATPRVYEYALVTLAPGVAERDYFLNTLRLGALNVWYLNDKATLKKVEKVLQRKGLNVLLFTRDELDATENEAVQAAHRTLIDEARLVDCDVLLTTCLLQAGVNITNVDKPVHITFGSRAGLVDIIQFPARFRRRPPSIALLHAQTVGRLLYFDEERVREAMGKVCRIYQRLERTNLFLQYDEQSARRQRVNAEHINGVMRGAHGTYRVDEYYLLSKKLECLERNARHNKLVLEQVLREYHFVLTQESTYGTGGKEADAQAYRDVTAEMQATKKQHTAAVVAEMLDPAAAYVYRQERSDPVRYKLEARLRFLTEFVGIAAVRADPTLLGSTGFRQFGRRVAFLLVEQDKALDKQLPAQVLHENGLFHRLKLQLKTGRTYTQCELKELVASVPELGYTPKTYLTAIKVLFHVRAEYGTVEGKSARTGYTLEQAIGWQDYERRPTLVEARRLDYACLSEAA